MPHTPPHPVNERSLILLVGMIQFVNILDFMMVMPLGPDFAKALGIPTSDIGLIGGMYTFAAAICGLVAALFLDQFSRKKALLFCLSGLTLATLAGAVVWDKQSMLAARFAAGLFGGPLTSLGVALIADFIPPERRGAALGKVMGGFAAASVIGVPFGLELASRISWHAPFIATGILGALITVFAYYKLPYHRPFGGHRPLAQRVMEFAAMLKSPLALAAYGFMALSMMAGFMIIPNIAAHLQVNLNYPRAQLGLLYFCGGVLSFFGMRAAGWMVDRSTATRVATMFSVMLVLSLALGFVFYPTPVPVLVIFILFMVSMTGRNVCAQTLSSKIPKPHERGAYMSVQSAITHLSSAIGAYYSSLVLVEENGVLLNVKSVGITAIILSCLVPPLFWYVERHLHRPR